MTEICIGKKIDQYLVCKNVAYGTKSNAVYVIDINCVPLNDLNVDGFIYNNHSCLTQNVEVVCHHDNLVACKVVSTKKNKGENMFEMCRQYSYPSSVSIADTELKRAITRFTINYDSMQLFLINLM